MIEKVKWIFSPARRLSAVIVIIVLLGLIYTRIYSGQGKLDNKIILLSAFLVFIGLSTFVLLGRAKIIIDPEKRIRRVHMGLLGLFLTKDDKQLTMRAQRVVVLNKTGKLKRSLTKFLNLGNVLIVYDIFLISGKGRPQLLLTIRKEKEKELAKKIAQAFMVEYTERDILLKEDMKKDKILWP